MNWYDEHHSILGRRTCLDWWYILPYFLAQGLAKIMMGRPFVPLGSAPLGHFHVYL